MNYLYNIYIAYVLKVGGFIVKVLEFKRRAPKLEVIEGNKLMTDFDKQKALAEKRIKENNAKLIRDIKRSQKNK